MQKINSETVLRDAILHLESRHAEEGKMLKEQFLLAYESIKPINIIKSTFKEATESQDLKDNLINTSVGITVGFLSKAIFENVSGSPFRKLVGIALQVGITNVVAKNPEAVKSFGKGILNIIRSKPDDRVNGAAQKKQGSCKTIPIRNSGRLT